MRLIEWEVSEDGYEEQIVIPKEKGILPPPSFFTIQTISFLATKISVLECR